jgi:hypothetical protein
MSLRQLFPVPAVADDVPVYGEPYQTPDDATVITVSRPGGWLRPAMRPVGVFVVHNGEVTWAAAEDHTRLAVLGIMTGLLTGVIGSLAVLRRPPWPDLSYRR